MNDTISLLLATAVLAVGGLGLYVYKTSDDVDKKGGSKYKDTDNDFFQTGNQDNYFDDEEEDNNEDIYESKVRARNTKTKRNKKNTGTKRRY
jgi:hypothetical protein